MPTVTYLEQTSPAQLQPGRRADVEIALVTPPQPEFNAGMYRDVGADWNWLDRRGWTVDRWATYLADPRVTTLSAGHRGQTIGFAELRTSQLAGAVEVELVYFGLLPRFAGRGLGGWFLSEVCRAAWDVPGCRRVWLHTCVDDSPAAMPNYLARGFVEFARADTGCAECSA